MRVIYLLDRLINYGADPDMTKCVASFEDPNGKRVGVYDGEWPHVTFGAILEHCPAEETKDVTFEVWMPDSRASVVHTHTFANGVIHKLFPAESLKAKGDMAGERRANSPMLVSELVKTDPANTLTITSNPARDLARSAQLALAKSGHKTAVQFHGHVLTPALNLQNTGLRKPAKALRLLLLHRQMRKAMAHVDAVLYLTGSTVERLKPYFGGREAHMHQLSVGMEAPYAQKTPEDVRVAREKLGIPQDATLVFSSSRLGPHKQVTQMMAALAQIDDKVPNLYVCVTGRGEVAYLEDIKQAGGSITAAGRLIMPGFVSGEDLWAWYRAADVFVNSSLSEGGPISSAKALAVGTPVITTPSGTVYEFLEHALAKMLVPLVLPTRKHADWPAILEAALTNKSLLIAPVVSNVERAFGWRHLAPKTLRIYRHVLFGEAL